MSQHKTGLSKLYSSKPFLIYTNSPDLWGGLMFSNMPIVKVIQIFALLLNVAISEVRAQSSNPNQKANTDAGNSNIPYCQTKEGVRDPICSSNSSQSRCDQLRRELAEERRKKIEVCKSNRVSATRKVEVQTEDGEELSQSACLARAAECAEMNSSEAGVDFAAQMMMGLGGLQIPTLQFANYCKELTSEERRALRSKEDNLKNRIEKIQKEITEVQENAEKQKREIDKAIKELNRRSREEDLKMKEAERQEVAESQKAQIEAQRKIRELQRNALAIQNASAKLTAERARALGRLTNAAIQRNCSEAIQAEIKKLSAENPGLRRRAMKSANSLIAKNSLAQQSAQEKLRECIREAQKVREETRIDFQGKIDDVQQQYDSVQKEINELQSTLTLMDSQRAQAKAEQEQNKIQVMQERMSELFSLQQELQSNTQINQQRIMQLQQQLRQAQLDLNKASNELATADQRPDGKFDISMAIEHAEKINEIESLLRSSSCPGYEGKEDNLDSSRGTQ